MNAEKNAIVQRRASGQASSPGAAIAASAAAREDGSSQSVASIQTLPELSSRVSMEEASRSSSSNCCGVPTESSRRSSQLVEVEVAEEVCSDTGPHVGALRTIYDLEIKERWPSTAAHQNDQFQH